MFSIKEHPAGSQDYYVHECTEYKVSTTSTGKTVLMKMKDGSTKPLDLPYGAIAFVMNEGGKTIDIVNPGHGKAAALRGAR